MAADVKASVLVIFHNQEKDVDRAISSILAQKVDFPIEVLIGDDGSTDRTWDKVQKWVDSHPGIVHAFRIDRNDGVTKPIARASSNRLFLTRKAAGKYLVYLDGDDYFPDPSKLQTQADILDANDELGSCAHNFEYVDEELNRLSTAYPESEEEAVIPFRKYWKSCYLPASSFMFRRPTEEVLGRIDASNFDDNSIIFPLASIGDVHYIGKVMFSYVQKGGSTWNDMDLLERVLVNRKDFYYEMDLNPSMRGAVKARHSLEPLRMCVVPRKSFLEGREKAEANGLFDREDFCRTWDDLSSDKLSRRLSRKLKIAASSIPPAAAKTVSYLGAKRKLKG